MIKETIWTQTMKCEEEPVLSLRLRRPEPVEDDRGARRIGRYYQRLGELWKARWETVLYPRACAALAQARESSRPFQPWEAGLDYTVTLDGEGLVSLYLDSTEKGHGRPLTVRSAETWDWKTGTPCSLPQFLPKEFHHKRELLSELASQAEDRLQEGESLFFEDVADRIQRHFSPARFYLVPGSLVIFYPMLSLGSAAEGIPTFSLPRPAPVSVESPEKS